MGQKPNDGGPAFPHLNPNFDGNWDKEPQRGGMSLRDWFAGQALAGLSSAHDGEGVWTTTHYQVAKTAYEYADAMIAERDK